MKLRKPKLTKGDAPPKDKRLKGKGRLRKRSLFVLSIGDDGVILIQLKKGEITERLFAADEDQTQAIKDALKDDPGTPVLIILDTLDQTYVQQTLPPVAALSVGKLMRKRLEREFPDTELKGVIGLGREKGGRK